MGQTNELLTYKEVQGYLKISESTLHRIIHDPVNPLKVTYVNERAPRIRLVDLTEWINKQDKLYAEARQDKEEKQ